MVPETRSGSKLFHLLMAELTGRQPNPKSDDRNPKEIRNPKAETPDLNGRLPPGTFCPKGRQTEPGGNPKPEGRRPKEIRNPKLETARLAL